jgi:hypothetical protein
MGQLVAATLGKSGSLRSLYEKDGTVGVGGPNLAKRDVGDSNPGKSGSLRSLYERDDKVGGSTPGRGKAAMRSLASIGEPVTAAVAGGGGGGGGFSGFPGKAVQPPPQLTTVGAYHLLSLQSYTLHFIPPQLSCCCLIAYYH